MADRKYYLLISAIGLLAMVFGQFMAQPQFYGSIFGRSWAHVFWLGFLLFALSLVTLLAKLVANNKNLLIRKAGKYQILGIAAITVFIFLWTVGLYVYEMTNPTYVITHVTISGYDGSGRRGMFLLWLLFIIIFTVFNLLNLFIRHLRQAKRF